jgi:pimeloyl-ACP methyl ester carboxylesterase
MTTTRRIVLTRFGQMHVRSTGGAGRPLVLLHRSARSGEMWEEFQERAGRASFAPDRLGFGFSDAPPWALTIEQYAQSTLEALNACHVSEPFDIVGVHTGALEAVEMAHQAPDRVGDVVLIGVPLMSKDEAERALAKYGEQTLRPVEDGSHILAAWRACFAFRNPPYDLLDAQRRLLEFMLAPNAGADYRAVCSYPAEKKIKGLKKRLTVFAPRDDSFDLTSRVTPLLREGSSFVDLPGQSADPLHDDLDRMIELINAYLSGDKNA